MGSAQRLTNCVNMLTVKRHFVKILVLVDWREFVGGRPGVVERGVTG